MKQNQKKLNELKSIVEKCQICEISKHIKNKVFGVGPIDADIISLSEAPGKDEDKTGLPYQGDAGKRWEQMLLENGWHRDSLYVLNAQCCKPINNKLDADLHTIDNCNPFMLQQIEYVRPKLILVFGKTALYSLGLIDKIQYEKEKMAGFLGEHMWNNIPVIVSYHPSYLLRQPKFSWDVYLQMCRAKEIAMDLKLRV